MITQRISRRNPAARRQGGKLHGAADEKCIAGDEEGIWALALKGGEGRIDFADSRGVENLDLQPDGRCCFLRFNRASNRILRPSDPSLTLARPNTLQQCSSIHSVLKHQITGSCLGFKPSLRAVWAATNGE